MKTISFLLSLVIGLGWIILYQAQTDPTGQPSNQPSQQPSMNPSTQPSQVGIFVSCTFGYVSSFDRIFLSITITTPLFIYAFSFIFYILHTF